MVLVYNFLLHIFVGCVYLGCDIIYNFFLQFNLKLFAKYTEQRIRPNIYVEIGYNLRFKSLSWSKVKGKR